MTPPLFAEATEATFLAGSPARLARLALWPTDEPNATVELALPGGGAVAARDVPVRQVSVAEALDELLSLDPKRRYSPSVQAWSLVARLSLEVLSRGRIEAYVTDAGHDAWRVGPLSEQDRAAVAALGGWIPPSAHCVVVPSADTPRIHPPEETVLDFWNTVADLLPRTAAADQLYRYPAWTGSGIHEVGDLAGAVNAAAQPPVLIALQLVFPDGPDASFEARLLVRSATDPSVVAAAEEIWAGAAPGFGPTVESDLLLTLRRAGHVFPALERLLQQAEPTSMTLSDSEAMALLGPLTAELELVGLEVHVPRDISRSLRATAHIERSPVAGEGPGVFNLSALCELTWRPTLGGEPVTEEELALLAETRRPLVHLRGEWVVADPRLLEKLRERRELTTGEALAAALGGGPAMVGGLESSATLDFGPELARMVEQLRTVQTGGAPSEPVGLEATLRPYQRRGLAWLQRMTASRLGGVLADDMGLGKTIQMIALHLSRIASGERAPMLVVCPATLVSNWEREFERFAPGVRVQRYHGLDRSLDDAAEAQVVVTTYGILRRDAERLARIDWSIVVADEAQQVKNPSSGTARALRRVPAGVRFALTGTPIENRLGDLWSLMDWTSPSLLGSADSFRHHVTIPVERDHDSEALERFSRVIAPFVLRRRKSDPEIAPDLPPKTETDHPVVLSAEQAGLYRAAVDEALAGIAGADGIRRRGLVLKLLNSLKQICNHPAHFLGQEGPLAGRSGKMDLFDELVTAISDAGDSTLIFTHYVEMGHLLVKRLEELGLSTGFLHGSLSLTARAELVDRFQAGEFQNFVVSLKAGGTGLNLTAATHVIHFDRWWNPAVENQASDRAWRIGQDRPVQIHRLISDGTLEERIAVVLAEKSQLAEAAIGSGDAWLTELDDADLRALVALGGS